MFCWCPICKTVYPAEPELSNSRMPRHLPTEYFDNTPGIGEYDPNPHYEERLCPEHAHPPNSQPTNS